MTTVLCTRQNFRVYIGRSRKLKLANVGWIRKVENYRWVSTESRDRASSTGRFIHIASKSSSFTRLGSEKSFTPRSTYIEPSPAFSWRSSQTLSQINPQTPGAPSRASALAPSRAETKGKVRVYAQRHSVPITIINSDIGKMKQYPPAAQEWYNSICIVPRWFSYILVTCDFLIL